MPYHTSIGLDVHARSIAAAASAMRDPRPAELPSRKHQNVLANTRISDLQSCVEPDTPDGRPGARRTI